VAEQHIASRAADACCPCRAYGSLAVAGDERLARVAI
jgi:hypothetical protein